MKNILLRILLVVIIGVLTSHGTLANLNKTLDQPRVIKNPSSEKRYLPESRRFTGIPSLSVSPKGRLWSVWYAGMTPGEDLNNYVVIATSNDQGKTWKETLIIDPDGDGPIRAFDPEVWIDPYGKLWVFWAQMSVSENGIWASVKEGSNAAVWSLKIDDPDADDVDWSTPVKLTDGVMMCKPNVLSTGEWVLPVSIWKFGEGSARIVVSDDEGITWEVRGGASVPDSVRSFDEHMIIERKNGSLWMLIRTEYGIGESLSNDRGFTWTPVVRSRIQHPTSRFFIYRLNSGNLLLVKHGSIDIRTGRSHLMAFISSDDGYSWSKGLLLDERVGVSYPDGQQASDGTIYIAYDYNRLKDQNILITSFTEEDVRLSTDNAILGVFKRRLIVSQGGAK